MCIPEIACETFGVEFTLTGALGVRRRHQQQALPQLVVGASRSTAQAPVAATASAESAAAAAAADKQETVILTAPSLPSEEGPFTGHPAKRSSGSSSTTTDSKSNTKPGGVSGESSEGPEEGGERRRLWRLEDVREDNDIMEMPRLEKE